MFVNTEIYSEPINGHTSWQNVQYSDSVTKTAAFLYFINFIHILQPRKTQSSDLFVVTEYTSFGFLLTTMCINKLSKLYLTEEGKSQRKPANSDKLQYVHLNGKCVLGVGVRKQPAHNRLHCSHQRSAWWDVRLSPPPLLHLCVHNYTATKNYRLLKCATFHNQHSAMQ